MKTDCVMSIESMNMIRWVHLFTAFYCLQFISLLRLVSHSLFLFLLFTTTVSVVFSLFPANCLLNFMHFFNRKLVHIIYWHCLVTDFTSLQFLYDFFRQYKNIAPLCLAYFVIVPGMCITCLSLSTVASLFYIVKEMANAVFINEIIERFWG